MNTSLIFVYAANSGWFNTASGLMHKLFTPETYKCNLCMITHGLFSEKKEWNEFISSLKYSCSFLHQDEFLHHQEIDHSYFPSVFLKNEQGVSVLVSADQINSCSSIQQLKILVHSSL